MADEGEDNNQGRRQRSAAEFVIDLTQTDGEEEDDNEEEAIADRATSDNNAGRGRSEPIDLTQTDGEEEDDNQEEIAGGETENSATAAEVDEEQEAVPDFATSGTEANGGGETENDARTAQPDEEEETNEEEGVVADHGANGARATGSTRATDTVSLLPARKKRAVEKKDRRVDDQKSTTSNIITPSKAQMADKTNDDAVDEPKRQADGTRGLRTGDCEDTGGKSTEDSDDKEGRKKDDTEDSNNNDDKSESTEDSDGSDDNSDSDNTEDSDDGEEKTTTDGANDGEEKTTTEGAKRMRKLRKARAVEVAKTIDGVNFLFVLGNRSSAAMAVPLDTEMGQNFQKENSTPWKQYDVLQLVFGKDGTSEQAWHDPSKRIDFGQTECSMTIDADRLFPLMVGDNAEKLLTNGCNAGLAHFLLEQFQNPSIGPGKKPRICSNHPDNKKEDDPYEHASPGVLFTRLDTLLKLIENDDRNEDCKTGKFLRLNFEIIVLGETRSLSPSERRNFFDFVHTEFELDGGKLAYPPTQVLKALSSREAVEDHCASCGVDCLDKAHVDANMFTNDKRFWDNSFLFATKDLNARAKDATHSHEEILKNGLVCKVQSDEDAPCRLIFLKARRNKKSLDPASPSYMATELDVVVKDREGNSVSGDFSGTPLRFEPFVPSFKTISTSVFVELKSTPKCHYYVKHPLTTVKEGKNLQKPTRTFCKNVANSIMEMNPNFLWTKHGNWKTMIRVDIFSYKKVLYLNQVNLVTTCDAFIRNAAEEQSTVALEHLADSIKSFAETKLRPMAP